MVFFIIQYHNSRLNGGLQEGLRFFLVRLWYSQQYSHFIVIHIMEVRNFFWPSTGFKIFLAPWFCSSYSITTVVVLKFPGPMVLFIIRYHNSRSLKIFLAQWFCSPYDITIAVVLNLSWPPGFVHHTVSQQYHNSITTVMVLKFSWPHGFVHHTISQQSQS